MNTPRRTAVLVPLTVGVIAGASLPARTAPGTLSTSSTVDADDLVHQPRLSVTTVTTYGWTARSPLNGYVSC